MASVAENEMERQGEREYRLLLAAAALYDVHRTDGMLGFHDLTQGQRRRYLDAVRLASRSTDMTALRAGLEAAASTLASHDLRSLRDCPPHTRVHYRELAQVAVRAYERTLTEGTEDSDRRVLALRVEELETQIDVAHTRALTEHERETVERQARLDVQRFGGVA